VSPRQRYAQQVIALYRCAPGTSGFARRADRCLAATLFDRRVPLQIVQAALLLAAARRAQRPNGAAPLARIASLHYFLPIIDELLDVQPDPGYIRYLRQRLATIAPDLLNAIDHQIP
jgi:hypothetical protein